MYRNSAKLVRYLAAKNNIPLDRAHIIGHDQVPGTVPSTVRGMHWDPGPYWDWEHYFDLLGAPIYGHKIFPVKAGSIVTIKPGFAGNVQVVSNCDAAGHQLRVPAPGAGRQRRAGQGHRSAPGRFGRHH
jgi:hypothetical protein